MIAMDLAKIASIDMQETMGGAELYELFGGEGEKISNKEILQGGMASYC